MKKSSKIGSISHFKIYLSFEMGISIVHDRIKIDDKFVNFNSLEELAVSEKVSYFSNAFFYTTLNRIKFLMSVGMWVDNRKIKTVVLEYEAIEKKDLQVSKSKKRSNGSFVSKGRRKEDAANNVLKERVAVLRSKLECTPDYDFNFSLTLKWSLPLALIDLASSKIFDEYLTHSDESAMRFLTLSHKFHRTFKGSTIYNCNNFIKQTLGTINSLLMSGVSSSMCVQSMALAPIIEEVEFSLLLQEIGLRLFPKLMIKKIAPGKEYLVDHPAAKVARVVLKSVIFALAHYDNKYQLYGLINRLKNSLILGTIQESTHLLLLTMAAHIIINSSLIAYTKECS